MSYLLALDQSTQVTGWALFKDKELIQHGHYSAKGKEYTERIADLRSWVAKFLSSLDEPVEVVIEDIQLQQTTTSSYGKEPVGLQTYKKLAHVQGALISLFEKKKIPYSIVLAASWKSSCGVKGKNRPEQKKNAQLHVKNTYGLTVTEDEADAICIGEHGCKPKAFNWK